MKRLIAVVLLTACAAETGQQRAAFSFENEVLGSPPTGWRVDETNGAGTTARWAVVEAELEESGGRILSLEETRNSGQTYNLMLLPDNYPADLTVRVQLRANRGVEDQGGGLVWRAVDGQNYYIARWNPLEDNFRAYYVKDGHRTQIATATVSSSPGEWHTIRIVHRGSTIQGYLDGRLLLEVEDSIFTDAGGVGLWTKADAETSFDDLMIID